MLLGALVAPGAMADVPKVSIAYPPEGAVIDLSLTPAILLEASVADPPETVTSVEFQVCPVSCMSGSLYLACGACSNVTTASRPPYQARWKIRPLGQGPSIEATIVYQVTARVTNVAGQMGTAQISIMVRQPPIPYVTLVAPKVETGYVTATSPVLYATVVSDTVPASTVDHVDFLDGDSIIGTVATPNAAPTGYGYAFVWQNAPAGMHLISARATNTLGYSDTSDQVTVYIVGPDPPPQVTLTSPTTGQIFTPASIVPLSASASSALGTIQRVEFTTAHMVIDTVFSPPYSGSWVNPPPGNFAVVAKAYDDVGVAAASPAAYIQVLASPRTPSVVLTAPAPGATLASGTPLAIAATALAPDGAIGRVDFYAGMTLLGSAPTEPYQFIWANPGAGPQSLTGRAYDLQGNSGASAAVPVTVVNHPGPTVSLISPPNNTSYVAPATIALSASASGSGASIAKVEFFANATLVATQTASPFSATWTGVQDGTYVLTARATDSLGATATSSPISVTVNAANQLPQVALTGPADGQNFYFGQPVTVTATATDVDGTVSKVEFLADGVVFGNSTSSPYSAVWSNPSVGAHVLSARATDNLRGTALSAAVNITVRANTPPSVALVLPRNGQAFAAGSTINLVANAADADGTLSRVDFYADGTLLGSVSSPPFSLTWNSVAAGSYTLTARAVDDRNAVTTSSGVGVVVQPAQIIIIAPADNATVAADFVTLTGTYLAPANSGITVNGVAAASDGQHFSLGNVPLADGVNNMSVVLTMADGQRVSQSVAVRRAGTAPFKIDADTMHGVAPLTTTITINNRGDASLTNLAIRPDGGQFDTSVFSQTTLAIVTYSTPGVYRPTFTVTDSDGNTYEQALTFVVEDPSVLDQKLKAVWSDFTNSLAAGVPQIASSFLSPGARVRYQTVFSELGSSMQSIVASFGTPQTGLLDVEIAEYAVRRTQDRVKRLFFIYLVPDSEGIWRIDSM